MLASNRLSIRCNANRGDTDEKKQTHVCYTEGRGLSRPTKEARNKTGQKQYRWIAGAVQTRPAINQHAAASGRLFRRYSNFLFVSITTGPKRIVSSLFLDLQGTMGKKNPDLIL